MKNFKDFINEEKIKPYFFKCNQSGTGSIETQKLPFFEFGSSHSYYGLKFKDENFVNNVLEILKKSCKEILNMDENDLEQNLKPYPPPFKNKFYFKFNNLIQFNLYDNIVRGSFQHKYVIKFDNLSKEEILVKILKILKNHAKIFLKDFDIIKNDFEIFVQKLKTV